MKEFYIKLFSIVFTGFIGLASLFFLFDNYLSNKIDEKITDKIYMESLSKTLRPFLIFNQNEIITYDHGAVASIDSIKVFSKNPTHLTKIIIYSNQYLQLSPLIESLGPDIYEFHPKRGIGKTWIYDLMPPVASGSLTSKVKQFYRSGQVIFAFKAYLSPARFFYY